MPARRVADETRLGSKQSVRPRVSVVIPTVGRTKLRAAVASALAQEPSPYEVLICWNSNTDPARAPYTEHPRVRVISVPAGEGGNAARQAGIRAASGDLIALLDDDDTWQTDKLSTQLALVGDHWHEDNWVASSTVRVVLLDGEEVRPPYLIGDHERLTSYLMYKKRLKGMGMLLSSTLLFPRSLGLRVPFDPTQRFHQDVSWLLAVDKTTPQLRVFQAPQPLTNYWVGDTSSVSSVIDPKDSVDWAVRSVPHDRRALGDFVLTIPVLYAARLGRAGTVLSIAKLGFRYGRPGFTAFAYAILQFVRAFLFKARHCKLIGASRPPPIVWEERISAAYPLPPVTSERTSGPTRQAK